MAQALSLGQRILKAASANSHYPRPKWTMFGCSSKIGRSTASSESIFEATFFGGQVILRIPLLLY